MSTLSIAATTSIVPTTTPEADVTTATDFSPNPPTASSRTIHTVDSRSSTGTGGDDKLQLKVLGDLDSERTRDEGEDDMDMGKEQV
ncbi:LOW QUALITY PROTEIN: hypothetical protein CVT26_015902 [Gymnopilus dilepis]|uniref:Uncharacterized protein n=1 Tax=Gymnopilus dilepis TaxID=231916 RepID=A0A409WHN1_9AGAR|nr:LOW QUALITY PROTEIN: hypothetical protein CVT26_015902 [Gymnopilus dilepis]